MLRNLTRKKKIIFLVVTVIICVVIGLLIFSKIGSDPAGKKKVDGIENQETSKEDSESEKPYDGKGLDVTDESEDAVESIPWSDADTPDTEESDGRGDAPSIPPKQDSEQNSEQDSEGGLEDDVLDDGKEWGSNIS